MMNEEKYILAMIAEIEADAILGAPVEVEEEEEDE